MVLEPESLGRSTQGPAPAPACREGPLEESGRDLRRREEEEEEEVEAEEQLVSQR